MLEERVLPNQSSQVVRLEFDIDQIIDPSGLTGSVDVWIEKDLVWYGSDSSNTETRDYGMYRFSFPR